MTSATEASSFTELESAFSALASVRRLRILAWLADPTRHFPPQEFGDLVEDGVCSVFIADKLGLSQPTTSAHMKALVDAGFVIPKRLKKWTFYRSNPKTLEEMSLRLQELGI